MCSCTEIDRARCVQAQTAWSNLQRSGKQRVGDSLGHGADINLLCRWKEIGVAVDAFLDVLYTAGDAGTLHPNSAVILTLNNALVRLIDGKHGALGSRGLRERLRRRQHDHASDAGGTFADLLRETTHGGQGLARLVSRLTLRVVPVVILLAECGSVARPCSDSAREETRKLTAAAMAHMVSDVLKHGAGTSTHAMHIVHALIDACTKMPTRNFPLYVLVCAAFV